MQWSSLSFFKGIIIMQMILPASGMAQVRVSEISIYETSASGNKMAALKPAKAKNTNATVNIYPEQRFQEITGFGGSFTHASANLLKQLSPANSQKIIEAYFGEKGANYSLTRTHINSCDFSLYNYAYANIPGDKELAHFDIAEDEKSIIPMIQAAQKISKNGFRIIASPWTAPPWMKDNNDWRGGKLLPEYQKTWALYFAKYINAYSKHGIPVWGVTVENEPLGNDKNWESMHFSPEEMTSFVNEYLGPTLKNHKLSRIKILGYDQNRGEELEKWASVMYKDRRTMKYFDGMAIHWYASTYDYFPASLNFTKALAPDKYLINTEACIDAEVPKWKDDEWYWRKEATDWGWDWASEKEKYLHPKYAPVFRYVNDIIGCLNNGVDGWIDWNMVLDKQGGPNWFKNWCIAPVIVDPESDEVYFTPLYYALSHFSRFIRPGGFRIGFSSTDQELAVTAVQNPDKTIAIVVFNPTEKEKDFQVNLGSNSFHGLISPKAVQTLILQPK